MFEAFEPVTMGTCTTSGTGDYVINGTMPMAANPNDTLVNGGKYWYHCYHKDGTTSGYEWGNGVYTASTDTLTRNPIRTSNTDALVSWPDTDEKIIAISSSPEMMTQFALQSADLGPGDGLFIVGTGQSNNYVSNFMQSDTLAQNDNVYDWSTDGAASPSAHDWRIPDPDDEYLDHDPDTQPRYIGYGRSRPDPTDSDTVKQTAQLTHEVGKFLQLVTGRTVFTLNVATGGVSITDWAYGATNTGSVFNDEIAEALTALDNDYPEYNISAPHYVVFAQGEKDADDGMSSGEWAVKAFDFIADCEQSERWGWADPLITKWFFTQTAPEFEEKYSFNGHAVLGEITPEHVQIVTSKGMETYDRTHFIGESIIGSAKRVGSMIAVPSSFSKSINGLRAREDWKPIDVAVPVPLWENGGQTNSAPSSGEYNWNVAGDKFRLHHEVSYLAGNVEGVGFERLGRDQIPFTLSFTDTTNTHVFTLSGLPTEYASYWEWDLSDVSETGTVPTSTNLTCTCSRYLFNGTTVVSDSDMQIKSLAYKSGSEQSKSDSVEAREQKQILADSTGILYKRDNPSFYHSKVQTTNATSTTLMSQYLNATDTGRYEAVTARVFAKNSTDDEVYQATVRFSASNTGTNCELIGTTENTEHQGPAALAVSVDTTNNVFTHSWNIKVTGQAATTWVWNCHAEITEIVDA